MPNPGTSRERGTQDFGANPPSGGSAAPSAPARQLTPQAYEGGRNAQDRDRVDRVARRRWAGGVHGGRRGRGHGGGALAGAEVRRRGAGAAAGREGAAAD